MLRINAHDFSNMMRLQINQQIAERLSGIHRPTVGAVTNRPHPVDETLQVVNTKPLSFEETLEEAINLASTTHGVDVNLIRAIIRAESNYNPLAVSHAGAMGLMQLMPATAERLGVTNAFDINQNINAGTQYMASLLERFDGDVELALAAYNAGWPRVQAAGNTIPQIAETINYVPRVLGFKQEYILQQYSQASNQRR
ncbi:MAG: lytic transglycosylase domain-containing protein [Defluviitaleaceae bacterium]|nr:lytic transglycosylase domain-containing protein [Defluviitaleaceae bacterium]